MSELHISDGENLIKNPNEEWGAVLKFLGLKRIEFNYEKSKNLDKLDFVSSFFWSIFERKWVYFDLELYLTRTQRLEFS